MDSLPDNIWSSIIARVFGEHSGFTAITLASAIALAPAPTPAEERYFSTIIASWHVGDDSLNNLTPGLTIGRRWSSEVWPIEYHLEGGVFFNSYEEVSPILLAGISRRVSSLEDAGLHFGASVGLARYEELSESLESRYGIPNVNGFIPIVVASLEYRLKATSYRITLAPPGEGVTAIFNLSVARQF